MGAEGGIGTPVELAIAHPVEGIGGIALVAVVRSRVCRVARPKVEIVPARNRVGLVAGETAVGVEPVGADQIDLFV